MLKIVFYVPLLLTIDSTKMDVGRCNVTHRFALEQCSNWAETQWYAVPPLLHFTPCTVSFSCAPALLTSCRYSFLPSQSQVLWEIHYADSLRRSASVFAPHLMSRMNIKTMWGASGRANALGEEGGWVR